MNSETSYLKGFCDNHPACVLKENKDSLCLIVMTPPTKDEFEQLSFACQKKIEVKVISAHEYKAQYGSVTLPPVLQKVINSEESATIIEYCHSILRQAIDQKASDIHIEPHSHGARIRFRVDGVLHIFGELTLAEVSAIESRFKLLAGVDIAENRRPQDGQLTFALQGSEYSFRIATLPTRFGEKVVLRLLETFRGDLALENLGMPTGQLGLVKVALDSPQGLIIVTGPTGSGKTTTLYSALNYLNSPERNLCTVEDPIEMVVTGTTQTQINLKAGLDFATILRALLRQDPDIVMIGEIRDNQTAEIAIKAAQTGHLVLSTLHTNSTVDTLSRLTQMGIAGYLTASALKLIIAQRLVRRLCGYCRRLSPEPLPSHFPLQTFEHWLATGCERCKSGYLGRHALFELLPISSSLQYAIIQYDSPHHIRRLLQERNVQNLFEIGLAAVVQGITTYQEVLRIVGENDAAA